MNVPLLVREVERLARERGWSRRRLAQELGVDATTLSHVHSGRDPISLPLLVRIGMAFGGSPVVQSLILHYLLIEAPPRFTKRRVGATAAPFAAVPYKVRWRIRRWLAQLDGTDTPQRGLFLTGRDAALLSAAARFAAHELGQKEPVVVVTVRGNERLNRSEGNAAAEARLLIVERVEFASEGVARLLHARSDALRPMIVTSCVDREQLPDSHLVRVFRAWTETITVSASRTSTSPRHAQRS